MARRERRLADAAGPTKGISDLNLLRDSGDEIQAGTPNWCSGQKTVDRGVEILAVKRPSPRIFVCWVGQAIVRDAEHTLLGPRRNISSAGDRSCRYRRRISVEYKLRDEVLVIIDYRTTTTFSGRRHCKTGSLVVKRMGSYRSNLKNTDVVIISRYFGRKVAEFVDI